MLPLRAQDEPTVSLKFCLIPWLSGTGPLSYALGHTIPALPDPGNTSDIQDYSGPATLRFYANQWRPTPAGGKPPTPAGTITFPKDVKRVIVLASPLGHNRYLMYAIPVDGDSLPAHSIHFYNFTQITLRVACGDDGATAFELKSGETKLIPVRTPSLVIRVARFHNDRWRVIFGNVAPLNKEDRQNVILAPGRAGALSDMFLLPDWPAPPAPTKPDGSNE